MTVTELVGILSDAGVVGLLAAILIGGAKQWWVWGWYYREANVRITRLEDERDGWRDLALQGTSLAEKTVELARNRR